LGDLGDRICVMGPSNSGKSTLAAALGRANGIPVVYLDQLRHLPGAHWVMRPDDEFVRLHDEAVDSDRWVIEGNYSAWMAPRVARATGFIFLDVSTGASLFRYLKRTLSGSERAGGLDGVHDRVSWEMIRWILGPGPRTSRRRHRELFEELSTPKVWLHDRRELDGFYAETGLSRA
jgi:adenylate kinase family enzyme